MKKAKRCTLAVGVKTFLRNSTGKYLLLKRAKPYEGEKEVRWDIPGGRIIPGEPLLQALSREIKEETGMQLKGSWKLLAVQDILRVEGSHTVRVTYTARAAGKIVLKPKEHTDYGWFTLAQIRKLHCDKYLLPLLKQLAK